MNKYILRLLKFLKKNNIKKDNSKVAKIYFLNIYVIVYIILFLIVIFTIVITKFNLKYVSIVLIFLNIYTAYFFIFFYPNDRKKHIIYINKVLDSKKNELVKDFIQIEKSKNKKRSITKLILKDMDNYDLETWDISKKTTILIGKGKNVDIDLSNNDFSHIVSRVHGVLNKVEDTWIYEDMESKNGSGIEKNNGIKQRIDSLVPYSLEYGDYLYIGTIKILIN